MSTSSAYRRRDVFLVAIDGRFALVAQALEQVHILNGAGAWVWSRLGGRAEVPAALQPATAAFLQELDRLQLLGREPPTSPIEAAGTLTEAPAVLSSSPLQVAANTSDDPFESEW